MYISKTNNIYRNIEYFIEALNHFLVISYSSFL